MEKIKSTFENKFEIIFIKLIKVKEYDFDIISKYLEAFKYDKILKDNNKYEILIAQMKDYSFDKLSIFNLFNQIIEKKLFDFNIHLINLENNINFSFINESKILYTDNQFKFVNQKFNTMKEFFKLNADFKKKSIKKIIKPKLERNKKNLNILKNESDINIILIKNFGTLNIKLSKFLSLISLFGNIINLYYNYYDGSIFVKYSKNYEVIRLLKNKNYLKYNDELCDIRILNSSNRKIITDLKMINEIIFNPKINRFNKKIEVKYNPPSNVIHISNIKFTTKIFKVLNLVKKYSDPLLMKFILKKKKNTKMCLIKFKSLKDSINVIINLHNKIIDKKKLKISFSFNKF